MKRNKSLLAMSLAPTVLIALGLLNAASGQETSIIRALPNFTRQVSAVSVYQDSTQQPSVRSQQDFSPLSSPARPDEQESPSDRLMQQQSDNLKQQQQLDDQALTGRLGDPTISSLFEQGRWPRKGIRAISLDIREKNDKAPKDMSAMLMDSQAGSWSSFAPTPKVFAWAAPDIRYQPLYFENAPLERYGQSSGPIVQNVKSAAHFFSSIVLLPYHMRHDHPNSCDYPLGFCRPGDAAPCTIEHLLYGPADR